MQRYIVLRILQAIAALLVISMIVFALARVTGDPVAILLPEDAPQKVVDQVREKWGLDQPIYVQYIKYIGNFVQGDFGEAWAYGGIPISGLIIRRLPNTLYLAAFAWDGQRGNSAANRSNGSGQERQRIRLGWESSRTPRSVCPLVCDWITTHVGVR